MNTGTTFRYDHMNRHNGLSLFLTGVTNKNENVLLQRELSNLNFLVAFTRDVSSSLNLKEVLDSAAKLLYNYFNYSFALFSIKDLDGPKVYSPLDSTECKKGWLRWANRLPLLRHRDIIGYRFLGLASPLQEADSNSSEVKIELPESFGSITLYCSGESAALATRPVLTGIGESLVTAIKNAREHNRVKELSLRDGLTGLYNRRVLEEILHLEESKRVQSPTSILLIDVDDFKMINDTYGHPAGDIVLSKIGKLLMDNSRKENIVARYGGEEFAVLLINTRLETALKIAERLRIKLGEQEFSFSGNRFKLSVSIGVAANEGLTLDKQNLVAKADQALYQAKRAGKNRVCSQENSSPSTMPEIRRRSHPRFASSFFEGATIA